MAYTDSTKISNYLQRALTQYETDFLVVLIPAIKLWIDQKTSSTFDIATETTRYYDGGSCSVDIDPCTDVATVSLANLTDGGATTDYDYILYQDYVLEPQNSNVKKEVVNRYGKFPAGLRRIKVTAKFSEYDGGVPEDIILVATRLACLILTAGRSANTGNVQSESLEGHSITYKSDTSSMDDIADSDPIIKATLELRRELLVG